MDGEAVSRNWMPKIASALLAIVLAGCDRAPAPGAGSGASNAATQSAATSNHEPSTREDAAPSAWPDFEKWAVERLQRFPAPVPLPEPKIPDSKWWIKRLSSETMLNSAKLEHGWKPEATRAEALAQLGPFRSDQRGPNFAAQRLPGGVPGGGDAFLLWLRGFHVEREAVGALEVELVTPFGREVTLKWGRAGELTLPISSNSAPYTLRVLTDGFAEWTGALEQIQFVINDAGSQPVELRSLRFLPHTSSFPEPINVARVRLGTEIRTTLYAHTPSRISYPSVALPAKAVLQVGLGVAGTVNTGAASAPAGESGSVRFEIIVVADGKKETVLDKRFSADDHWHDEEISLERFGGKSVQIILHAVGATPQAVAFWANPMLYEPVPDAPVVVLYLIDTLSAEHLQLYGYERDTAPNLTKLAKENAWFEPAFSNAPRTIESIPDMMLSMPTERHGVHQNSTMAAPELVTLAEMMRDAGYATASFCTNVNAGPRQGMDQGFDHFFDEIGYFWDVEGDRTVPLEKAADWIAHHRDRPIFLYVHTAEPHAPYTPPEGYGGFFDKDYAGPIDGTFDPQKGFHAIVTPNGRSDAERRRDLQHVVALYDEEIRYADARFAAFYELLGKGGLAGRANVMVVADHGEEFLQHGQLEHGMNLHNEQTRIPFLFIGPRAQGRGQIAKSAQLFDVMPTILDLAGVGPPYAMSGESLLAAVDGKAAKGPESRDIFASNHNYRAQHLIEYSIIRDHRWKLIYGFRPLATGASPDAAAGMPPRSNFALYDIQADPHERNNLLAHEPKTARELALALVKWREANPAYDVKASAAPFTAAEIRNLEAGGYLGGGD